MFTHFLVTQIVTMNYFNPFLIVSDLFVPNNKVTNKKSRHRYNKGIIMVINRLKIFHMILATLQYVINSLFSNSIHVIHGKVPSTSLHLSLDRSSDGNKEARVKNREKKPILTLFPKFGTLP